MQGSHHPHDHDPTRLTALRLLAGAACCVALAASASAEPVLYDLGDPAREASLPVPIAGGRPALMGRLHVASDELVRIGIGDDGAPRTVRVDQRLVVTGVGDLNLRLPAGAISATALPGSTLRPGLRDGAVLWQGFAGGHKAVAARVVVNLAAATRALPLGISVVLPRAGVDGSVTLANRTVATGSALVGRASRPGVRDLLALLAHARPGVPGSGYELALDGAVATRAVSGSAPLRVRLALRLPAGVTATPFPASWLLGDGAAATARVRLAGSLRSGEQVAVRVEVALEPPAATIAAGSGRPPADGLAAASRALLALGIADRYAAFLVNPDAGGTSTARYVFETIARPDRPPPHGGGGAPGQDAWWAWALLGVVLAAGGARWWARS